jgi:hypothetical protein
VCEGLLGFINNTIRHEGAFRNGGWKKNKPMVTLYYIYLSGSILTVCLVLFNLALGWTFRQLSGEGWYWYNTEKIGLYRHSTLGTVTTEKPSLVLALSLIFIEAVSSWIGLLCGVWKLCHLLLAAMRTFFSKQPEELIRVRFPLRANPDLEPEAVWAHLFSLSILMSAGLFSCEETLSDLAMTKERVGRFDEIKAISYLENIGIAKKQLIDEVRQLLAETAS